MLFFSKRLSKLTYFRVFFCFSYPAVTIYIPCKYAKMFKVAVVMLFHLLLPRFYQYFLLRNYMVKRNK